MSSPSSSDRLLTGFQNFAEAEATATAKALIEQAAQPALAELEAFRAALDARVGTLAATLAGGAAAIDSTPIQALVERLARAAGEEATSAAQAARTLAIREADARRELDRAEAQKQLDAMREEAAEQRNASLQERNALTDALEKAKQQTDALRVERDAQIAELRRAQEHADKLRADRDAQLEALRVAQEQADTLRADRDAQIEAVRVAAEQVAAMAAERDTHRRTAEAALEEARTVQGEQDALLEAARISNGRHTRLLEQAQARADAAQAQAAAAEAQAAEARTQADAAQAQLAAAHAQAETAQAQLAVAQAQLVEAQEQLAAAQAEAERRLAVGAGEIEALRLELERVRADMQAARAVDVVETPATPAAAAIASPAPTVDLDVAVELVADPTPEPAMALVADPAPEPAIETISLQPIAHADSAAEQTVIVEPALFATEPEPAPVALRAAVPEPVAEPEAVAEPVPVLVVEEPEPAPAFEEVDAIGVMYRAIGSAADLSQVLDALIDGVGALFPRAALFVVKTKSKRLQGWRSVGFTGPAAITREFEFPLTTDSALTRAVTAGRTIFTGEGQPGAQAGEAWTVTFPVTTGGRVVAVVHADGGGRTGDAAPAFDRETALDLSHTLVRMAGERIGALTMSARAAFGNVMNVAPAEPAPAASGASVDGVHASGTAVNGSRVNGAPVVRPAAPADAGRYASQLVSEINRYAKAAAAAPADGALQERLAGQIEGSSAPAAAAAPAAPASALGLFDEALNKMLGSGALEQAPAAQSI